MPRRSCDEANALVLAMIVIMLLGGFIALALDRTSYHARLAQRDRETMKALAAADGGLEEIYAAWQKAISPILTRVPTDADLAAIPAPTSSSHPGFGASGITLSDYALYTVDSLGVPDANPVPLFVKSVPDYRGWAGFATFYCAELKAGTTSLVRPAQAKVRRHFQRTTMPLFQAAIFYEGDLEIHPGPNMTISGLVHTNSDLYALAYSKLRFMSDVSYAGSYNESVPATSGAVTWGGMAGSSLPTNVPYWADDLPSGSSTSKAAQLHQVARIEPFGADPSQLFDVNDANTNNDGFHELIEPPASSSSDPAEIAALRLYNQATLKINMNTSLPAGDPARVVVLDGNNTPVAAATATAVEAALTNQGMFDRREATTVNVTSVDMQVLNSALGGVGGFNGVLYIQDAAAGKNAIRLKNGAVLGRDLTIASRHGMYIQGDFNTGGTTVNGAHVPSSVPSNTGNANNDKSPVAPGYQKKSVAVVGDAVTILSNNWDDANAAKDIGSRIGSPTTVNAAILSGNVETNYNGSGNPSGGVHNFPRFLENWGSNDFTYWGSMVQLFNSDQFTGLWQTGNTYSAPARRWNFDPQFLQQPPPGSVAGTQYSRGRWERLYAE